VHHPNFGLPKSRADCQKYETRGGGMHSREIFKFNISEMPFTGLWRKINCTILMVRKQHYKIEIYISFTGGYGFVKKQPNRMRVTVKAGKKCDGLRNESTSL
jgi:hypothetical protein